MLPDRQKCLESIHSLQNVVCTNYRELTEQEVTLEEKVCKHKVKVVPLTYFFHISAML